MPISNPSSKGGLSFFMAAFYICISNRVKQEEEEKERDSGEEEGYPKPNTLNREIKHVLQYEWRGRGEEE